MRYYVYLFIIVLLLIAALCVFNFIRYKIRQITHSVGGVIISQLASEMKEKQVSFSDLNPIGIADPKSVSDLTSAYLPVIARDFPNLNVRELISAVQNVLLQRFEKLQMLTAPNREESEFQSNSSSQVFSIGTTDEYDFELSQTVQKLRMAGQTDIYEGVRIHASGINRYEKKGGTCQLIIQSALEYFHYTKINDQIVSGSDAILVQIRYNIQVVYVQDQSKLATNETTAVASTCPNCGAPISRSDLQTCEYCGSAVQTVDMRIWRVNSIEKV